MASRAVADDASVLPRGRSRVFVDTFVYFDNEKRFNPDGDLEPHVREFAEPTPINSSVFAALAALDPFTGGPGTASLGDARVEFTYDWTIVDFGFQYGLTDRLTAGFHVPYYWATNTVDTEFNSAPGSSATVGFNPGTQGLLPLAVPGTQRLTLDQVQQLIGPGLGTVQGFGFDEIETWEGQGFGDLEAGVKHQYFRGEDWTLAATFAFRAPTGEQDDPDSLVDLPFGGGAWALLLRLQNDYQLSNLWKEPKPDQIVAEPGDVVLNGTFRFDWVLPDRAARRIPDNPDQTFTTNREVVDRDYGDKFEFEVAGRVNLLSSLSLSGLYRFGFKLEDRVTGDNPHFHYSSLEKHTDSQEHLFIVGLSFSTLPLYLAKKFPLPMAVSVAYRDRFAGRGPRSAQTPQVLNTQYVVFGVSAVF
jgi:hypothetical protein